MPDETLPKLTALNDGVIITLDIPNTDALLNNQGYTYNEATFTYNQASVAYGGVYNTNQDIVPMILQAESPIPINFLFADSHAGNNQRVVGPGWFMFIDAAV